jgi:hypothetical protein
MSYCIHRNCRNHEGHFSLSTISMSIDHFNRPHEQAGHYEIVTSTDVSGFVV